MLNKNPTTADLATMVKDVAQTVAGNHSEVIHLIRDAVDLFSTQYSRLETRLDGMELRLNGMELRLEGVELRLEGAEHKTGSLEAKVTKVIDQLADHNTIFHDHTRRLQSIQEDITLFGKYILKIRKLQKAVKVLQAS